MAGLGSGITKPCTGRAGRQRRRGYRRTGQEKTQLAGYAYKVCKIFVMCSVLGGGFKENIETVGSAYFSYDELPVLAEEKNNKEQIKICFDAFCAPDWRTIFD